MEQILDFLLKNKNNRADCIDLYGKPFQIGVYRSEYGFLVATAFQNGKAVKGNNGLILSKQVILSWLADANATLMEALKYESANN